MFAPAHASPLRWLRRLFAAALLAAASAPGAGAQGWIEPPPDRPGIGRAERVRTRVSVEVDGRTARIVVTEWFRNPGGRVAEGDYIYPLPADAAFGSFSLYQGDDELRGEVMDADEARSIYEAIVRRRKDPALIELAGHGLLRARVFPIEPGRTRKVTLRYTQLLERSGDALHFRYAAPEGVVADEGSDLELIVTADGERFLEPFSPTHDLETGRDREGRLEVRAVGSLRGRLSVLLPLVRDGVGLAGATHALHGEDGYVMLTLTPGRAEGSEQPRDVTAVVDVSGSMSGEKIRQARRALGDLLATLGPDDRFRIVAFSNTVRPFALEWSGTSRRELSEARAWIDGLRADGGTNIGAALDEAFRLHSPAERLPVVLFLTDGLPSVGERSPERIAARAERSRGRARIFAFGVGHDVNTRLLDGLTDAGRGATGYVEPGESVERALSLLAGKIRHPVLTDLRLVEAPVRLREMYPVEIPDVFAGEELILLGRYERPERPVSGRVVLEGRRAGRTERFGAEIRFPDRSGANAYLPRLWGARKLGFLTRKTWTGKADPELVEEIRRVALRYGLPSPYTSYMVTEPGVVAGRPDVRPAMEAADAPTTQGAGAVRRSREARRLRDVSSVSELEEAARGEAQRPGGREDLRKVAGRLFRLADGVWTDVAVRERSRVIDIEPFSAAYFALADALPELRPYWSAFERVRVAGGEVTIGLAGDGRSRLEGVEVAEIVRDFRRPLEPAP